VNNGYRRNKNACKEDIGQKVFKNEFLRGRTGNVKRYLSFIEKVWPCICGRAWGKRSEISSVCVSIGREIGTAAKW